MSTWAEHASQVVPKPRRMKLAKSELLVLLAAKTLDWERSITNHPASGTKPFEDWDNDDPFRDIARRYGLIGNDLGRILHQLGDELERRAERAGYGEAWL